ncbi:hypothetical protein STRIP9103_01740 [Streptomyces ipomoeae 91-03]|uniref:Uncharacterized protein n=1 Tax=Streptomyces ipomoeae 91-03 TaxID=698759 RepID=L1L6W3_9ACTN|nr:hypothetical protein STRIP9103_01740 [Streptomyces ipomoeae 91-03]
MASGSGAAAGSRRDAGYFRATHWTAYRPVGIMGAVLFTRM